MDDNKVQGMMCWLRRGRERVREEVRECKGQEMGRIVQVDTENTKKELPCWRSG